MEKALDSVVEEEVAVVCGKSVGLRGVQRFVVVVVVAIVAIVVVVAVVAVEEVAVVCGESVGLRGVQRFVVVCGKSVYSSSSSIVAILVI